MKLRHLRKRQYHCAVPLIVSVKCCVLASDSTYERCCEFERIWAVPIIALPMRAGPTPAATRAGDDGFFLQARLACISVATVCFAAAAGLEGQKLGSPLIAALPGVAAAGALAYRARPALALTPPLTLDDVEIREAPGKGEGLFASRRIKEGQFIMDYLGEEMSAEELDERYENLLEARYALELTGPLGLNPTFIDAVNKERSNLGRYINHCSRPTCRKVRQRFPDRRLRFFAARDIDPGEELTFDYGESYWIGRENELVE